MRNPIPRVAAIHDLAGFARTSLTAAIPILSSMGIQATPLPTAILSTQTVGYNDFTLLDLTDDMVRILDHWERLGLRFDGVYSGFMAKMIDGALHAEAPERFPDNRGRDHAQTQKVETRLPPASEYAFRTSCRD